MVMNGKTEVLTVDKWKGKLFVNSKAEYTHVTNVTCFGCQKKIT